MMMAKTNHRAELRVHVGVHHPHLHLRTTTRIRIRDRIHTMTVLRVVVVVQQRVAGEHAVVGVHLEVEHVNGLLKEHHLFVLLLRQFDPTVVQETTVYLPLQHRPNAPGGLLHPQPKPSATAIILLSNGL